MIESDGSKHLKLAGDARKVLQVLDGGLKGSGLDPKLGQKLLEEAVKKGLGDLLKKKKKKDR